MLREMDSRTGRLDILQSVVYGQGGGIGSPEFKAPHRIDDAIELAMVRDELETAIFMHPQVPVKGWLDKYSSIMRSHPSVKPYGNVINNVFFTAYQDSMRVSKFWEEAYIKVGQKKPEGLFAEASPSAAIALSETVMGFTPDDQPKAYRGAVTLRVILSDADYSRYTTPVIGESLKPISHFEANREVPLIVMPESAIDDQIIEMVYLMHELEHVKLNLLARAVADCDPTLLPDGTSKNLADISSDPYYVLVNEYLAYSSILRLIGNEVSDEDMGDEIAQIGEDVLLDEIAKSRAVNKEIDGGALRTVIGNATNALIEVHKYFKEFYPDQHAGNLSLNFLAQFPFSKWSVVTRLLHIEKPVSANYAPTASILV